MLTTQHDIVGRSSGRDPAVTENPLADASFSHSGGFVEGSSEASHRTVELHQVTEPHHVNGDHIDLSKESFSSPIADRANITETNITQSGGQSGAGAGHVVDTPETLLGFNAAQLGDWATNVGQLAVLATIFTGQFKRMWDYIWRWDEPQKN